MEKRLELWKSLLKIKDILFTMRIMLLLLATFLLTSCVQMIEERHYFKVPTVKTRHGELRFTISDGLVETTTKIIRGNPYEIGVTYIPDEPEQVIGTYIHINLEISSLKDRKMIYSKKCEIIANEKKQFGHVSVLTDTLTIPYEDIFIQVAYKVSKNKKVLKYTKQSLIGKYRYEKYVGPRLP